MSRAFEHLVDVTAVIIIFFLFPFIYFGQKQDSLVQTIVSEDTQSLVNDIRGKGYLTKEEYDHYQEELSKTGLLYNVTMEHKQIVHEPEYRFRTEQEIIDEQNSAYTGSNNLMQFPISTDIPAVSDPVNNGSLNTETNESVLASALNKPADPSHVHTDSCYIGTKHEHTGSSSSGGGCYETPVNAYKVCDSISYYETSSVSYNCSNCGFSGSWRTDLSSAPSTCPQCGRSDIWSSTGTNTQYTCTKCSNVYNYFPGHCTYLIPITTYALSCGKTEGHYYNGNTEVFPSCSEQITGIAPTHPVQTVAVNDPLITTVTTSYLDGSTKVVVGTTNFSTANIVQNQTITIRYDYMIGGTAYSKTCSITVTVIPRSKTCANGHTYNLNSNGSDPGCPYCCAWLSSLQITYPTSGNLTIYKGTTLQDNGVTLLATYMDGHTQILYNEYIDNLDENYVGTQNVTISYKGKYVYLSVITKRVLKQCPVCYRYYELYPDLSDPGCPYCRAKTPIYTGNVMSYYNEHYSDEILNELYEGSGIYYFTDRDYFIISVKNTEKSRGRRLLEFFFRGFGDNGIQIVSSGYIRQNGRN